MKENLKVTLWIIVLMLVFVLCLRGIYKSNLARYTERERERNRARAETREAIIGYPARQEQIDNGDSYFVSTAIVDMWADKTNYIVVLKKVAIGGPSDYRHSRTNRLFELPWGLERGYYRFFKVGTNLSYVELPPPARP